MVQDLSLVAKHSSRIVTTLPTIARMQMAMEETMLRKSAIEPTTTQASRLDTLQLQETRLLEDRPMLLTATAIKQPATPKTAPKNTNSTQPEPLARTPQLAEVNKTDMAMVETREPLTTHKKTMMVTAVEPTDMAETALLTLRPAETTSRTTRRRRTTRSRPLPSATTF